MALYLLSDKSAITNYVLPIYILLAGFIITQNKNNNHIFPISNNIIYAEATVISPVKNNSCNIECTNGLRAKADLLNYNTNKIDKGDKIFFESRFIKINKSKNSKFDYKRYMRTQYIGYTCSINNYKIEKHESFASIIHNWINKTLYETGIEKETADIIIAMLIGEKSQLDYKTKKNFIKAGAIHILAVSGLHTGIIYLLICFILKTIFKMNKNSNKFLIISLSILWMYAIITYLPSSICRASLIISFTLIGKHIKRNISIYNTIAASALIILLFDPNSLFTVGFQLSYAAYLSIIYFYPKIRNVLKTENYILGKFYDILSVSFAAQIGTLPLCLLYFGQVACYSVLTNILIAFLIPIIMYIALISIIISLIHIDIISIVLNCLIRLLTTIVSFIAHLSGAVIHLHINIIQTFLIYTIVYVVFRMIWLKKKNLVFYALFYTLIAINSFTF